MLVLKFIAILQVHHKLPIQLWPKSEAVLYTKNSKLMNVTLPKQMSGNRNPTYSNEYRSYQTERDLHATSDRIFHTQLLPALK